MKQINNVHIDTVGFHEGLQKKLSTYPEKIVNEDRSVTIEQVNNSYFLVNDKWKIDFSGEINQFEEVVGKYNNSSKNIHFQFNNPLLNLEVKYIYYQQLFNDLWTIQSIFVAQTPLKKVTEFLNTKYPKLTSLLALDIDKVEREY
ncbi:transposase, partial [Bacillus toyonensis]|nr:transposase [Bacillus toyonensis]